MPKSYGFPIELLDQKASDKVEYFKNYTVAHQSLKDALTKLLDIIKNPGNRSVILVYGPSGVGKTTLFYQVFKKVVEDSLARMKKDPGFIPISGQEAVAPDTGNFDWKDFYIRALESLEEPLINKKVDLEEKFQATGSPRKHVNTRDPNRHLRKSLEQALRQRNPYAYIVDEAQHLSKIASGRKLRNQMDTIKSLASLSKVPHILIGTYELLPFRNLSGQLSRRGTDIHFQRYQADKPGDMETFINILWAFQKHLPLEKEPDLTNHYEYFYERCIGCVGILKDWLLRTYIDSVHKGIKTLLVDDFVPHAHSLDQCIHMVQEARVGERALEENTERQEQLKKLLGIDEEAMNEETPSVMAPKRATKRKVGERSPKRDVVGEVKNEQLS